MRFENAALRIDERNGCAIEYKAVSKSACLYSVTARGRELGDGVECRLSDLDVQQAKSHNRLAPENCSNRWVCLFGLLPFDNGGILRECYPRNTFSRCHSSDAREGRNIRRLGTRTFRPCSA